MVGGIFDLLPLWVGLYLLEGLAWVRRERPLLAVGGDRPGGRWLWPALGWTGLLPPTGVFAPRCGRAG